ncbi:MAG: hypothetical protein K2Q24_09735 [Chitinophagaceae bacterium]|nr:hypothetical protein [Chitinophagaceae bacterium]
MVRFFSGNNPFNVIILFFLGIFIKLPYFITPVIPQPNETDGFLYIQLLKTLQQTGNSFPTIYPIIAYVLLFTQAITFNGLINNQKLFATPHYLLALAYLVITSVVPEWNVLSPVLIINTIMVWAWPRMVGLYNHPSPKTVLFNIGFGFGLTSFFYFPSVYLLLLLIIALLLFRPFYLTEWLLAILGILTPFYFLLVYFFVWDRWEMASELIPQMVLKLPDASFDWKFWIEFGLISFALVIGLLMGLKFSARMLVQTRKSWNYMIFYLIIALIIPFVNSSAGLSHWILAVVPVSLFHAAFYYYPKKKNFAELILWLQLIWIVSNYVVLNSR